MSGSVCESVLRGRWRTPSRRLKICRSQGRASSTLAPGTKPADDDDVGPVNGLPLPVLLAFFVAAGAAVWMAGTRLVRATDVLDMRLGLGEVFGGLHPARDRHQSAGDRDRGQRCPDPSVGHRCREHPGRHRAADRRAGAPRGFLARWPSVTGAPRCWCCSRRGSWWRYRSVTVMGSPACQRAHGVADRPGRLLIVVVWVAGLFLVYRARKGLPWHQQGQPPDGQERPRGHSKKVRAQQAAERGVSTRNAAAVFVIGAAVTLAGGALLELSGDGIATQIHMSGVLFGSTVLAAATSLPRSRPASLRFGWATTSWPSATSSAAMPACRSCSWWRACCGRGDGAPRPGDGYLSDRAWSASERGVHVRDPVPALTDDRPCRPRLRAGVHVVPARDGRPVAISAS